MRRFDGKAVLVTGAASGIGRATALRLAGEGARLAIADRDGAGLAEVAESLRRTGAAVELQVYDAADGEASARMAETAAAVLGGLDCVVCNAGIYRRAHFADIAPADWELLFAVNLTSVYRIVQAALPRLKVSRGNVVTVASTAGIHGIAYAAHYAAAKAGIVALTKSLAVEFAPDGVRFNAVCPGRVKTAIGAGLAPLPGQDEALLVRPPKLAGRIDGGEPEDVASAIAWLASAEAAYATGSVLVVDGAQNIG
jgi:NAD(P)-dependent dehydrogenase (short-subunit alcohol dehydrogenase family)